jgi:hypothetical protein
MIDYTGSSIGDSRGDKTRYIASTRTKPGSDVRR